MPIRPRPFKIVCQNCKHAEYFFPKSDVVSRSWGIDYIKCSKCGGVEMTREKLNKFDEIYLKFTNQWKFF